jgi:hypothetical protein
MGAIRVMGGFVADIAKGLFTEWLIYWLPLTATAVATYLKLRGVPFLDVLPFALGMFAAISVSIMAFAGVRLIKELQPTDPRRIETTIRDWSDKLHYGVQRLRDEAHCLFNFQLSSDGRTLNVCRERDADGYLAIMSGIVLSDEHQAIYDRLGEQQRKAVDSALRLEMARMRVGFHIDRQPFRIILRYRLPITSRLTEHEYITSLQFVDMARIAVADLIAQKLNRY